MNKSYYYIYCDLLIFIVHKRDPHRGQLQKLKFQHFKYKF